jgi:hypothetical protein
LFSRDCIAAVSGLSSMQAREAAQPVEAAQKKRTLPMTNMLKTITLAAAMSGAGVAAADPARETFSIEFRYNSAVTVEQNYARFLRDVRDACSTPGPKPIAMIVQEKTCVQDVMDQLVARLGRADLASVHLARTGRQIDASRDFAAK